MRVWRRFGTPNLFGCKQGNFRVNNIPRYLLFLTIIKKDEVYALQAHDPTSSTLLLVFAGAIIETILERPYGAIARNLGVLYMVIIMTRYFLQSKLCEVIDNVTVERL